MCGCQVFCEELKYSKLGNGKEPKRSTRGGNGKEPQLQKENGKEPKKTGRNQPNDYDDEEGIKLINEFVQLKKCIKFLIVQVMR